MNTLSWMVILGIVGFVVLKNWDRIAPMFKKSKSTKEGTESIELSKADIKKAREEKMQYLINEKEKRIQEIERRSRDLKAEIKEIDIEIYLLQEQKEQDKKPFGWKK